MEKRIKDLTRDEALAICRKHNNCYKCPLDIKEQTYCFADYLTKGMHEEVLKLAKANRKIKCKGE